ncbi:MAG: HlyD family efflux transporter periplasmic adaptor subunit [Bacteroidota bacterium]|nr:HlyD family efflux transporter periplasmic adaptor subunit [Bacteroidota bacterium]
MKPEEEKIEIRSDDMQEIVGRTPSWMIRYGIIVITISILILFVGSYFFKYPDVIRSEKFMIITENPPVSIIARSDGKLQDLSVSDNEQVNPGQILAMIENTANIKHVNLIRELLNPYIQNKVILFDSLNSINIDSPFILGDIQDKFLNFKSSISEFRFFHKLNYYPQKIESVKEELLQHKIYYNRLYRQRNLLEEEYRLANKQFKRDSVLFLNSIISEADYEKSKSIIIQKHYNFEGARTKLSDSKIRSSELNQEILDLKLNFAENEKQLGLKLIESFDKLLSEIAVFEQKYILKSPIKGIVSFNKIWSNNQFIRENETVFSIDPLKQTNIIGKLELSVKKSGKVNPGQRVNIKLDNFPHLEYGMVIGKVEKISRIPDNNLYNLEVSFPNDLVTNYNRELPFRQKMQGQAEIITENISLLTRIINPFKSIIKKQEE